VGVRVVHERGARFRADCRGHRIIIDQPLEDAGSDAGMTPPELFAASLGGCIGYYVARYCQQAGIDDAGLRVDCDWSTAEQPHRIGSLRVHIILPGLPEKRRKAVERAASLCMLHATLQHPPELRLTLTQDEPA
jgi:uncharacterized OsmC-like protein